MPSISTGTALWMIDLTLRATLILALACVIAALLRRASAALRHVVWTAAVAALLALPVMVLALPAWRALPRWEKARPASTNSLAATPPRATPVTANTPSPEAPGSAAAVPVRSDLPLPAGRPADELLMGPSRAARPPGERALPAWPAWVLAFWLAGIVTLLVPLGVAACALVRLRHRARPCIAPQAQQILAECRHELAIAGPVTLLESPHAAPMTFGILRPHILVPTESAAWSAMRWRIVLRHELAHIHRHDLLTQTLAQLMRAVYWFHPLAWFACARMAAERERACDDFALVGTDPSAYAAELFAVARTGRPPTLRFAAAGVVPMARLSSLESRVRAILDASRNRRRLTGMVLLAALLVALAVVLPVATLRAAAPDSVRTSASTTNPDNLEIRSATATAPLVSATGRAVVDPAVIAIQEAEVAIAKLHADNTTEIEAEKAVLARDQADLQRLQQMSATAQEIESAKLEVTIAQARIQIAQSKHEEAVLEYQRAQAILQAVKNGVSVVSVNPAVAESLNTVGRSSAEVDAMLALAKHKADDTASLEAEKAVVESREAELRRAKDAFAVGALTQAQLDSAAAELSTAKAQAAISLSQHEEEVLKYKLLQQQLAPKPPAPALTLQAEIILVVGQVPNPGKYQFHPDENLAQALADAGLVHPADDLRVSLNRVNPDGKTMTAWTKPFSQAKDFPLQRNDTLQVESPAATNH